MRAALFILLLSALTACLPEPEDPFFFEGLALDVDGAPLADLPLTLRRRDPFTQDGPLLPFAETRTDAGGAFLFEVEYRFLSEGVGTTQHFEIPLPPGDDGSVTRLDFTYYGRADITLPPLRRLSFSPPIAVHEDGVEFTVAGDDPLAQGEHTLVGEILWDNVVAWRGLIAAGRTQLPKEAAGGFADARLRLRALKGGRLSPQSLLLERSANIQWLLDVSSPLVPASDTPLESVLAGAFCELDPYEHCPLTDGALAPVWIGRPEITLKPKRPLSPRTAVLRGVQLSLMENVPPTLCLDGHVAGDWLELGQTAPPSQEPLSWSTPALEHLGEDRFFLSPLKEVGPVNELRLRRCGEGWRENSISAQIREISVFE